MLLVLQFAYLIPLLLQLVPEFVALGFYSCEFRLAHFHSLLALGDFRSSVVQDFLILKTKKRIISSFKS